MHRFGVPIGIMLAGAFVGLAAAIAWASRGVFDD